MRSLFLLLLLTCFYASTVVAGKYQLVRENQRLDVDIHALLAGEKKQQEVLRWVTTVAESLASVYGHWPRDHWRVEVQPISVSSDDPVPWAQVSRGDPDTVSFYIDSTATSSALKNNWTAYHEFSHLLIPYRGWGDMWFSEGLASYYQNLLQVRAGVFDEREMWQRIYDGFLRGQDNKRPDLSLEKLSDVMRENRSFMRVYWSGVWYFLRADSELRRLTNGKQGLDSALAQLNDCCANEALSVQGIVRRLDKLTGQSLFEPLYREVGASKSIPAFEPVFASLGISVTAGRVSLGDGEFEGYRADIANGSP